jgi:hypothetical protein
MSMWDWLFGSSGPQRADVPRPTGYPGAADVALARSSDASYGDPSAAFVQPQPSVYGPLSPQGQYSGRLPILPSKSQVEGAFNDAAVPSPSPAGPVSDNLMQGFLASRRSALAALGFDPHHMAIGNAPPTNWTTGGQYTPSSDQIVSTGQYPSTTVHESMHRGIQELRAAGMLPSDMGDEEEAVRAQMLGNYGDVELGRGSLGDMQVENARYFRSHFPGRVDALEAAAAKLYAQQHPRGPR